MEDEIKYEHESYGLLQISRQSSSKKHNLFGSSIKCENTICIRLHKAIKYRHLNRYWYHPKTQLFEVEMTPNQFAELITTLNYGSGVPVTIRYDGKHSIEYPQEENVRQVFETEFENTVHEIYANLKILKDKAHKLLSNKGQLKVSEKQELLSDIEKIERDIRGNIPFIQKSFNESMDGTVAEAKSEVDSFMNHIITTLGKEQIKLKENFKFLPEKNKEESSDEIT